ncbi:MAG: hypothetical protein V4673_00430 [Pseudomonadota bacterium]
MNAVNLLLFVSLALASAQASAHPPGHPGHHPPTTQVPQPVAPSTLPYETYPYGDDYPYAIDHDRYEYDTRGPCIAQGTSQDTSSEISESAASGESATPDAIDWCALAPYQPRYAPQIPASWWWHHRTPWRYGRTR